VDKNFNVLVTDTTNHNLQAFNSQGVFIYRKGNLSSGLPVSGTGDGEFNTPSGVATDSEGYVYVADTNNAPNRVQVFDPSGVFYKKWSSYGSSFSAPKGIAVDEDDNIIIVDSGSNKIVKVNPVTFASIFNITGGPWTFTGGNGLSIDAEGYIYLITSNNVLMRFRFPKEFTSLKLPKGISLTYNSFVEPSGIAVDNSGNIVFADKGINDVGFPEKKRNRIVKMSPEGTLIFTLGKTDNTNGSSDAEFDVPEGVALDEFDNIYVADTNNSRIQKFDSEGVYLTKWDTASFTSPSITVNAPKALCADANRKVYVANTAASNIIKFDSLQGLGSALYALTYIPFGSLQNLLLLEKAGTDISDELFKFNLDMKSFRYLIKLFHFAEEGTALIDEQQNDFDAILVQMYKNSRYPFWMKEEADNLITLSQDSFKIRQLADEKALVLPAWRSDKQRRRAWTATLQSRIDIENTLFTELESMLEKAEDGALMDLRDAIIMATAFKGKTLVDKAKDGTDKLLVDLKNNCCQRTTRVAQAMEALSNLIWSIRTGQLQDTYPLLSINAGTITQFEEEWQWMGSYSTWRAAQFVFMYPENLLMPSYRKRQSPAFRDMVDALRQNPTIDLREINRQGHSFYQYFQDISQIQLEASCYTRSLRDDDDPSGIPSINYDNLLYLFGTGPVTKSLYYSTIDINGQADLPNQSCWSKINGFEKVQIIKLVGTAVYAPDKIDEAQLPQDRFIYVFALVIKENEKKLVYIKFNLDKAEWDTDLSDLKVPDTDFAGPIEDVKLDQKPYEGNEMHLIVQKRIYSETILLPRVKLFQFTGEDLIETYFGHLKYEKNNYYIDKMYGSVFSGFVYSPVLLNYITTYAPNPLFRGGQQPTGSMASGLGAPAGSFYSSGDHVADANFKIATGGIKYLGGIIFHSSSWENNENYIFWREGDATNAYPNAYQTVNVFNKTSLVKSSMPNYDMRFIAGYEDASNIIQVIYQKSNGEIWKATASRVQGTNTMVLQFSNHNRISFNYSSVQSVTPDTTTGKTPRASESKVSLANAIRNAFIGNTNIDQTCKIYFEEAFYYVPMTIALTLQKRGNFIEALDWFSMIYDHNATDRLSRSVYHGLFLESSEGNSTLDDFDMTRLTVVSQSASFAPQVIDNPKPNRLNSSPKCGTYKRSAVSIDEILFQLPVNNEIDFSDPNFTLDILDNNGPTTIKILAKQKVVTYQRGNTGFPYYRTTNIPVNTYITYRTYQAQSIGGKWERLFFEAIDNPNPNVSKEQVDHLVIQIDPGSTAKAGILFYLDNIRSGHEDDGFKKPSQWLQDPLNPHSIAEHRDDTYTRYTVMAIVKCLLDYADSEYTQDNAESVPRARILYQTALELLNSTGMSTTGDRCAESIAAIDFPMEDEWKPVWEEIKEKLAHVKEENDLEDIEEDIQTIIAGADSTDVKLKTISTMVNSLVDDPVFFHKVKEAMDSGNELKTDAYATLLADPKVSAFVNQASADLSQKFLNSVKAATGVSLDVLVSDQAFEDDSVMASLRQTTDQIDQGIIPLDKITGSLSDLDLNFINDNNYDPNKPSAQQQLTQVLLKDLYSGIAAKTNYKIIYTPSTNFNFCVPPNPVPRTLRYKAELNLFKIRNCRNISGVVRQIDPFAAPTDAVSGLPTIGGVGALLLPRTVVFHPTIYRYQTLIQRAQQLVQIAQQVEASMLSSLEKLDAEKYSMMKAKQDLGLAKAGVQLQSLRVNEAKDSKKLAQLQKQKAEFQSKHFSDLLDQGLLGSEIASIVLMYVSAALNTASVIGFEFSLDKGGGFGQSLGALASASSTLASIQSTMASFERRNQEWSFERDLANQDIGIADEQVTIADDQIAIVGQEKAIAQMQTDNAQATIDFLGNKFTNAELYEWMSGVLEGAYKFFLQQATSMAKTASDQLAFERQELPPPFIKNDYWESPADNLVESGTNSDGKTTVDRKGLTGSVRLLEDIYQLDQFAFSTDKRKLELSKTISLAAMAPAEFQRFKETGEMPFGTSSAVFDRDFPGNYLRLIKQVKVTVVALIPPTEGIKATLSSTGLSYVVVGGDTFQRVPVVRDPESVGLTASQGSNGLFELNQVQSDKLFPFENTGVESKWVFSMPKASNFFDYSTIADVQITIQYTALHSDDYRAAVLDDISTDFSADRSYSFKNQFADQWYDLSNWVDLHQNDNTDSSMKVSFTTKKADFPVNLSEIKIQHLMMYFVKADDLIEDDIDLIDNNLKVKLSFTEKNKALKELGEGETANALISTRGKSGEKWLDVKKPSGAKVEGTWDMELPASVMGLFKQEKIVDIMFVISYSGTAPEWPK
jgi:sugar lactone lactonase YvrE